jgi:hypothetical protein
MLPAKITPTYLSFVALPHFFHLLIKSIYNDVKFRPKTLSQRSVKKPNFGFGDPQSNLQS